MRTAQDVLKKLPINVIRYMDEKATQADVEEAQKALYEDLMAIVGEDTNLSVASRGKELDDKFFNSKYAIRKQAQNELKAEIRTKLREYFGVSE